ncbi:hypothetical protein [Cryptosporangium phraense]|uniref:DUF2568 domain-containing protein n=1 Tax=Cryptosporangium phraense TaxID=2593070 RepID=A0A545AP52_9ACTN|nr:hypothetical protein [Cryptosporangium phraense]TQS43060.1 hypothetical protein FL583_21750 [Cryptosporangium phraense]
MSTQMSHAPGTKDDDLLGRAGRWLLAKIWFGCVFSGFYALSRHFAWPDALVSIAAALGALGLAVAAYWLPIWTREYTTGIRFVDVTIRVVVWLGLVAAVVSLLVGEPAVGLVAGALLLTTAWRTFGPAPADGSARGRIA